MLKHEVKVLSYLFSVVLLLSFVSCEKTKTEIDSVVTGTAAANPSVVKNGDDIILTIGGISFSDYTKINGEEYYPIIHYLVDGEEVALSEEKEQPFTAKWKVQNLSEGEHGLSVKITSSRDGATYENNVLPSTITVIE